MIYIFEARGFSDIQPDMLINTDDMDLDKIELVEWVNVGGLIFPDCTYIRINFQGGARIQGYTALNTGINFFDTAGVLTENIAGKTGVEMFVGPKILDNQYKSFVRGIGKEKKKRILSELNA